MVDLHLNNVTKRYGETTALADVNLDIRDGEFFTLVGPSGCGKTTTLRMIAGFEDPTAGSIRFGDRDVVGLAPENRDIGIVFQSYALFPHMTVGENIKYGLKFREPPGDVNPDTRVQNLLNLVNLSNFEKREPNELSGGQRQRVALARALAPGPTVLLLDEPMSALDARLREHLRRQIKDIQSALGITTVYVTHDQREALAVSDRVAVIQNGQINQVGSPKEIYREPKTEFVAQFIGENNIFNGEVSAPTGSSSQMNRPAPESRGEFPDNAVSVTVEDTEFTVVTDGRPVTKGDTLTFSVRPADIHCAAEHNRVNVNVKYREFLGEAERLYCSWEGRELVLRSKDPPESDQLVVGFAPSDARVITSG